MKNLALEQLKNIINISSLKERKVAFEQWQDLYLVEIERTQSVINKSCLSLEEIDFVWYHVATQCAESLVESKGIDLESNNTIFKAKLLALKNGVSYNETLKKNKKNTKKSI